MPTLHHTLDRGGSYIRARVYASPAGAEPPAGGPAASTSIAASREARFYLTPAGVDRLREHGCYDEGDYVPPELFREVLGRGEARERRRPGQTVAWSPTGSPAVPRLFPEPQPPCWMLPRRRTILGL